MTTYYLLSSVTAGAGGSANMTISGIPQTYTDLVITVSARSAWTGGFDGLGMYFNGSQSSITNRFLASDGSNSSSTNSTYRSICSIPGDSQTANTFSNIQIYIPNYTSSATKSIMVTNVSENYATTGLANITAEQWANSAAITSVGFDTATSGLNLKQYSTVSLYGILKGSGGATAS
jgi:hypothetical protein